METADLFNLFRTETRDNIPGEYLWSDEEVYGFMDEAQKMFCRLYGGIADSTSEITVVEVPAGTVFAEVSPLILKLRMVVDSETNRILTILNAEDLERMPLTDDYGHSARYQLDNLQGELRAVVSGMGDNAMRLVRIPSTDRTLNLMVYRLPLETIEDDSTDLEIDAQHHRSLLHWMKYLAHMKQDAETFDRGRAEEFERRFYEYCTQAKQERERRDHKYRSVAYGGL